MFQTRLFIHNVTFTTISKVLWFWSVLLARLERENWCFSLLEFWLFSRYFLNRKCLRWCFLLQWVTLWWLLRLVTCLVVLPHSIFINKLSITFATHHKSKAILLLYIELLLTEICYKSLLHLRCTSYFVLNFLRIIFLPYSIVNKRPFCHAI